jgi:hypothetical protein
MWSSGRYPSASRAAAIEAGEVVGMGPGVYARSMLILCRLAESSRGQYMKRTVTISLEVLECLSAEELIQLGGDS